MLLIYGVQGACRLLIVLLGMALLVAGCATTPQVKVAAEVFDPKGARNRSVAVVADLYMDDAEEAERLAGLVSGQLAANGFNVRETENEADLVVIPTLDRSKPTAAGAPALRREWRTFDLSYGLAGPSMMESQNALRSLGFEFGSASPPPPQPKAGLVVTAVTREAWFKALLEEKAEIPRVWRIIAVTSVKEDDVTSKLVEAMGSKLGEVTGGKPAETQKPPPAPDSSPRKKPAQ